MNVCCRLYPSCYCRPLPADDEHRARLKILRQGAPMVDEFDQLRAETLTRLRAQRQRNVIILAVAFVLVVVVLAFTLAGCGPDDGMIESPAPEPTTTEMFTVIRPPVGHLAGGIYDNN